MMNLENGLRITVSNERLGFAPGRDLRVCVAQQMTLTNGDHTLATYVVYRDADLPHTVALHGPLTFPFTNDAPADHAERVQAAARTLASWADAYAAMRRYEWARGSADRAAEDRDDTPPKVAESAADLPAARAAFHQLLATRDDLDQAPADIAGFLAEDRLRTWSDSQSTTNAEQALTDWATTRHLVDSSRDPLVRAALAANVNKDTIHRLTGMSRATINRLLGEPETAR